MSEQLKEQILDQLEAMPDEQQQRVLDFARSLAVATPRGVAGKDLLSFAGMIEAGDLHVMAQAIEDECESVNASEW